MAVAEIARTRTLQPVLRASVDLLAAVLVTAAALFALNVHITLGVSILAQQFYGLVLAISLYVTFLLFPPGKWSPRNGAPWYDVVLALLGIACGIYVIVFFAEASLRPAELTPGKVFFGALTIVLVIEACRRLYGLVLPVIAVVFILYALFADKFPGIFQTRPIHWQRVSVELLVSDQGMLGIIIGIVSTIVLVFILFGHMLFSMGGGTLFTDLALAALGRYRGGPAKVAVVGSSLFGSISGSAVANVVITGSVTIPMMKRIGYRPEVAGAVEATASTGGLVMPPVMSAVTFVMAEYLQIPYGQVVLAAIIPALLYYGSLLVQVDLEAGRTGMKGLPREEIPSVWPVLKRGWPFLLPIPVLVYTLVVLLWQPDTAGMFATLLVVVCGFWFVRHQSPGWWYRVVAQAGLQASEILVVALLVGIILGTSSMTGLSFTITEPLLWLGQVGSFFFLLATAFISLALGTGLPGIAIYFMQVTLIVPALVAFGIVPIAAHFFIFYFGVSALITPPVCEAAMAAAGIARADPMRTGWEATKLGAVVFIVPFVFVYSPSLLAQGPLWLIAVNFVSAAVGVLALGMALRGYLMQPVAFPARVLLFACAIGLFMPVDAHDVLWLVNGAALTATAALIAANVIGARRRPQQESVLPA
jgi:TRAP transporter 4TM/12TM fusion protein